MKMDGGAILPGFGLQFSSLEKSTALIPMIVLGENEKFIGRWAMDTENSLRSGIANTIVSGSRDFVLDFWLKFPNGNVVITGGDGEFLYSQLKIENGRLPLGKCDAQVHYEIDLSHFGMMAFREGPNPPI
mmetsp:Transcript_6583/g.9917  ORF Transcript_6583/g.9917 Transcript_6583/m.9917 type:complete len:130 (+) Transcript_6583:607-996(+)